VAHVVSRAVRARSRVDSRVTRYHVRYSVCRPRAVPHSVACRHALSRTLLNCSLIITRQLINYLFNHPLLKILS
jgi:hypothetical protein